MSWTRPPFAEGQLINRFECPWCKATEKLVIEGKGPHALGLQCTTCLRHNGWLPKAQVAA